MRIGKALLPVALAVALLGGAKSSFADPQLIEEIVEEVVDRTLDAIRDVILQNTGIDPLVRGYILGRNYQPVPAGASEEIRRELRKLNEEHDARIDWLREELEQKLDQAAEEFEREASKEDKAEKIQEKRRNFEEQVDHAFDVFREKVGEENRRFDEKRDQILAKL